MIASVQARPAPNYLLRQKVTAVGTGTATLGALGVYNGTDLRMIEHSEVGPSTNRDYASNL